MTRASMLALLRGLALHGGWANAKVGDHVDLCAICRHHADRVRIGEGDESYVEPRAAHEDGCKLAAAIAWLEDEGNRARWVCDVHGAKCCNVIGWLLPEKGR